ncbi:lamin tail domain-containing protein [Crossiella sp. CA-258035]|uniref:endonuclease/exonuclease/phosphatase family protein n=1 Tax=Crossiella sp. CA-258035 TaxID=2981138 RepID=UPI0024BC98C7|nr:endonuclease/exonuclease/phosphatase family protein [Crossiella sp. CA-258035]WHT19718.1 lamin tail domain-containing protein [Crossiella sp. CA-258035]
MSYRRRVLFPLLAASCVAAVLPVGAVAAPSPDVLISEVYGGGGNSGASLTHDFVELANPSAVAVDLTGWSVQYLTASPSSGSRWQATPLAGVVAAGKRYLVGLAKGSGGSVALPAPDATGSLAMGGSGGTVALVKGAEALTCLTAAECAADGRIRDLVGYGNAVVREGSPVGATSNATSAARGALTDTDDNAADFVVGEPTPVNSKGEGPGSGEPGPQPVAARIHQVQGSTRVSPLRDKVVVLPGVVTAVRAFGPARGFWVQDPVPDADPRTSEGLFVHTGSTTPAVAAGDDVLVTGTVAEFYPVANGEDPRTTPNQSVTQLTKATWVVRGSGKPLPEAEVLGAETVPAALTATPGGSIEALPLEPGKYALDFLESREGMRLRVNDARVVGATDGFYALWVTSKPAQNTTVRGGTVYPSYADANTGRLKVESLLPFAQRPFPKADVGDRLKGVTEGPLDYSRFGGYVLQASALGEHVSGGLVREVTRKQREHELAVATYNVENLSPVDKPEKFAALANGVVRHLANPDVVVLEEIQDDNGPANDAVVGAEATLKKFTEAIVAAGGPKYDWRQINPNDDQDGGQPGGNIRVGFLFNPARVSFVDRPGGDADTAVKVVKQHGRAALSVSPGRIAPADEAWRNSRKPLAGEFRFPARGPLGRTVFVVANHFASKGGDQPLHGRFQEPQRTSEVQRLKQAKLLRGFADSLRAVEKDANLVVAGDLNDYLFSPALKTLLDGPVLHAPMNDLKPGERYSYVFDGNSQTLDHILINRKLDRRVDYDVVHINAEFHEQASDHDPQLVRFRPRTGLPLVDALEDLIDCLEPKG